VPALVAGWLDQLDATGRWALLKLVTGGLRVGVSERLAKTAVAGLGAASLEEIEEVWHGLRPPYEALFAWVAGSGDRPDPEAAARFRPMMLSHPLEDGDLDRMAPAEYAAEWKWDGIRVQVAATGAERRLFSRTGEDVGGAFPDLIATLDFRAVLDGELLVVRDGRGGTLRRPAAAPQPQDRRPEAAGQPPGLDPRLRHPGGRRRGPARPRLRRQARASGILVRGPAPGADGPVAAARLHPGPNWRRSAPAPGRRRSRG
jgi:hypothetical protein